MKYDIIVGIDCGVKTGFATWDTKARELVEVSTLLIHQAMEAIENLILQNKTVKVRFEDARLRQWLGNKGREALQGAGSVKRDSKIWEDFLKDKGIDHEPVPPRNNKTKLPADHFKRITKWELRTSEHSRDAAMLVFGL